jgi:hypothetical protein
MDSSLKEDLKDALADYGRTIRAKGWQAGEPLIRKHERRFVDFRKWAHALGIMLRAEELLDEENGPVPKW